MIITRIIEKKRKEIELAKDRVPQEALLSQSKALRTSRRKGLFKNAITGTRHTRIIAEVKKASPSYGVIRKDFDPVKIAAAYEANGASAISVLTDKDFFQGSISHLKDVKKNVSVPVLRKDFIIDEYQIYESIAAGADAALLIADLVSAQELKRFMGIGGDFNLDFLVETHSEEDVRKALDSGCGIIGINNRDLHTFKIDLKTTTRLLKMIPEGRTVVSESGINTKEDISYLKSLGVDAVLVGHALMRSGDIGKKLRELAG